MSGHHLPLFTLLNVNMALAAFSIGVAFFALTFLAVILLAGGTGTNCRGWSCHRRSARLEISAHHGVDSVELKRGGIAAETDAVHAGAENDGSIRPLRMKENRSSFIEFDGKVTNAVLQHQPQLPAGGEPLTQLTLNKNQVRRKRADVYDVAEGGSLPATSTTKFTTPVKNEKTVKTDLPAIVSSSTDAITSASHTVEENNNARKTTTVTSGTYDPLLEPSTIEPPFQRIIAQHNCKSK